MERPEGIVFLCALWFIMGGQPTLYRKTCNIFNPLALLLFFKMILFSCGRLVRSSYSPLVYFESVRSGRLVLLYYMLKLSSAKYHHFWSSHILSSRPHYINAHTKLQHAWHLLEELQRQHKGVYREEVFYQNHFCITKIISLVFMFSCMSDIEHYQNEYENGRTRGILRNDPLANKLGMVEDGLSYSPIKVLALTLQSCIGRTQFASDLLHYFYFVTPSYQFKHHI